MENRKLRKQITEYKIGERNLFFYTKYKNYTDLNNYLDKIAKFLDIGLDGVELNGDGISDRDFLHAAKLTKQLCSQYDATFIVKSRADIALLSSADCVNLNSEDLDIHTVKEMVGEDILIGYYITSQSALDLVKGGADYINLRQISTPTEPVNKTGSEYAKWVSEKTSLPVILLGDKNTDYTTITDEDYKTFAIDDSIFQYTSPNKVTVNLLNIFKK